MSRLSPLQIRILRVLSAMSPPWRLTGGGALVGVHTKQLTLAWTLRGVDVQTLGRVEGWTERRIEEVDAARHRLIDSILAAVNDPDTEQS